MRATCVFFHAHPDDEALLTAGTMARLADEGHRVVLVVATAGERGLTAPVDGDLGTVRTAELHASARALGCARVVLLGYADSGLDGTADEGFASADVEVAAEELAGLLRQEDADLLTVYDPAGGYGHPDHVQVHRVGVRAAELAGTSVVLEATVDRDLLLRVLRPLGRLVRALDVRSFERAYASRDEITHRVRVGAHAEAKRASMAAHATQATGGDSVRTLAALLRLPMPLFRRALGTEYYVRRDLPPGTRLTHPLDAHPLLTSPLDDHLPHLLDAHPSGPPHDRPLDAHPSHAPDDPSPSDEPPPHEPRDRPVVAGG
ncbi:PIG-L deacetylase family protein [Actinomadura hibisca]|uniref:PIG-L deacetylase family protein n=1 Tax=Actinomadura hibisca TaxID=68565 RepID=UPI000A051566|nr:PIG-L family deacetylase [Actinomadura hibisca]